MPEDVPQKRLVGECVRRDGVAVLELGQDGSVGGAGGAQGQEAAVGHVVGEVGRGRLSLGDIRLRVLVRECAIGGDPGGCVSPCGRDGDGGEGYQSLG